MDQEGLSLGQGEGGEETRTNLEELQDLLEELGGAGTQARLTAELADPALSGTLRLLVSRLRRVCCLALLRLSEATAVGPGQKREVYWRTIIARWSGNVGRAAVLLKDGTVCVRSHGRAEWEILARGQDVERATILLRGLPGRWRRCHQP